MLTLALSPSYSAIPYLGLTSVFLMVYPDLIDPSLKPSQSVSPDCQPINVSPIEASGSHYAPVELSNDYCIMFLNQNHCGFFFFFGTYIYMHIYMHTCMYVWTYTELDLYLYMLQNYIPMLTSHKCLLSIVDLSKVLHLEIRQ